MNNPLLTSGGATGADILWTHCASSAGFHTKTFSFTGHSTYVRNNVVELNQTELDIANPALEITAKILKRRLPRPDSYIMKLLQRSWHIVHDVDAVYAVGRINPNGPGLGVVGGTAWGCEMYNYYSSQVNLYFYDMNTERWLKWNNAKWEPCIPPLPNTFARCAGIGSRDLTDEGTDAIKMLFYELKLNQPKIKSATKYQPPPSPSN